MTMQFKRFIDITANWVDRKGRYGLQSINEIPYTSFNFTLTQAWEADLDKIIITGESLYKSRDALELSSKHHNLFCTVGCHPEYAREFGALDDVYLSQLERLIQENRKKVVAIGCGLNYNQKSDGAKKRQMNCFEKQVILAIKLGMPLILHCNKAYDEMLTVLNKHNSTFRGAVSSFDGSIKVAERFWNLGFKIGVSGVTMKIDNYLEQINRIPTQHILVGSDFPEGSWNFFCNRGCDNNDPKTIEVLLELIATVKNISRKAFYEEVFQNTKRTFFRNL